MKRVFALLASMLLPVQGGYCFAQGHFDQCPAGDITGDCTVNMQDLTTLAQNWFSSEYNMATFGNIAAGWLRTGESVVVINEINYKPQIKTLNLEYVELYNFSPEPVNISGWSFNSGITYTFPAGTIIAGNGYLVVAQDKAMLANYYGLNSTLVFGPYSGKLDNDGEMVRLADALGNTVDKVDYSAGFPWPTAAIGEGSSLELINPLLDNDLAGNWRASGYKSGNYLASVTPTVVNSVYETNNAPCVRQVAHAPLQPHTGDPVVVSAKVTDPDGVSSVTLNYQLVMPGSYIPATLPNYPSTNPATIANPAYDQASNWVNIAMNDNGTDGDLVVGDGIYSATVPGSVQNHRNLLRYRITVVDGKSKSVQVPYNDDAQRNFAWFTYDSIPAWSGAFKPGSSRAWLNKVITYGAEVMNSLPPFQLIARNTDVMTCQYNSSYDNTSYYFSGTIVYNGRIYDNVHFHVRGQASTFTWGKNKWKFKFNPGHDFIGMDIYGKEYKYGADTLNLGTGVCPWWKYPHPDGSWDKGAGGMVMNEMLAYRLYQMAGAAASNSAYTQLRVIDDAVETSSTSQYEGDFWGLYITLEYVDGSFLDERNMADGNIFRMDGGYNQTHQCSTQPEDGSDITALTNALDYTTPTEQWWQDNFNLEHYYSTRSVGIAVNDADRRINANCVFYHDSQTNLWWYMPWDLDLVFEPGSHYSPSGWENVQKALNYSKYKTEYQNRGRELLDLLFNGEQTAQLVDEIAALIYTPGTVSFVDAERARWDNSPNVTSRYKEMWYANNEWLDVDPATRDFSDMVAFMKQTISPAGFTATSSAYASYGVPALTAEVNNVSPALADTPTVSYNGPTGYPVNDLRFKTTNFNSAAGLTFSAISWRIARIEPSGVPLAKGRPLYYEIKPIWQTTATVFSDAITVPAAGLEVGATYRVRCRMKDSAGRWTHWSAPITFIAGQPLSTSVSGSLRVTELMYNPAEPSAAEIAAGFNDNDLFEFIELKNTSTTAIIDLSKVSLSNGITYNFGATTNTLLAPGESVLLVADMDAFLFRYQPAAGMCFNIGGVYTGSLSNGGETISIIDDGVVFITFTYDDIWYPQTDGQGYSLVPDPALYSSQTEGSLDGSGSWSASVVIGGEPQAGICH